MAIPEKVKTSDKLAKAAAVALIAKKDFLIVQNEIRIEIKQGDDILKLKIPERFLENLKTENVI